ncbi:MAG: peptide chain release factor N(5)-glutamine methyltransferase [Prevotella sp.]
MDYISILRRLSSVYDGGEARAVTRLLLGEVFSLSLADIACGAVERLSEADSSRLENYIQQLERGVPVQYVLGYELFHGLRIGVTPAVLIPRPETAQLVDEAVKAARQAGCGNSYVSILDIGTGSGCIAIAIARVLPLARVEAWDISPEALAVARQNALDNDVAVEFRETDVLSEAGEESTPQADNGRVYDIIVSNPPYICRHEAAEMHQNVLDHEPHTALFVPDDDPLLFYRAISRLALQRLRHGGWLLFEINRAYPKETAMMLRSMGYADVRVIDDEFSNPRIISCRLS